MTSDIRSLFKKDIARHIDGVIKADDDSELPIELEEYVVTNQVAKRLEEFLHAYNDGKVGNGVWISGFFGSGKSHLLKILALLLENRDVGGRTPLSYFEEKFEGNKLLLADLNRAALIPSRSVLFNIDQQADVASQAPAEALLGVFVKMFNEMQGYYGKLPHVANFERDLDRKGKFDAFKEAFARIAGEPWVQARRSPQLVDVETAQAYREATGRAVPESILDTYWDQRVLSIQDFADRVAEYVEAQDAERPGFRLNFFVDEVGQYIADDTRLMTNLQTIAESLNTPCRGRAWIVVTAQQDMDAIIGDMNARLGQDFSKIMGRFDVKLPLNAADVAEVIQRRLLAKTPTAEANLGDLYDDEAENLRALFSFTDGTRTMRGYRDRSHFIDSYPFHPYQYELFQAAIQGLSEQNAFEGKYTSPGARSMLGTFQLVAKELMTDPVGRIASFDRMFHGVRNILKGTAQNAIIAAESGLGPDNPFAVQVLKALFLVKYVDFFKPTVPNVAILMRDRLDLDPKKHRDRVAEALNLLEQQSYVQRNGDIYEFLTDEEKDIERRIRAVELDSSEVARALDELLFGEILRARSISHERFNQEFPFAKRVNGVPQGKDQPLAINLVTPHMPDADRSPAALALRSQAEDAVTIVLPEEGMLVSELNTYLRTQKFLGRSAPEGAAPLLSARRVANTARRARIMTLLRDQIGSADMLVRGEVLDLRVTDPRARIEAAFEVLVDRVYTALPMLRGYPYKLAEIEKHLDMTDDGGLTEAEREVLNRIAQIRKRNIRSTVGLLVTEMGGRPYGWAAAATLCMIGGLIGRGRLEARRGPDVMSRDALLRDLTDDKVQDKIDLEPQEAITASQVIELKIFLKDVLDAHPVSQDGKGVVEELTRAVAELRERVRGWQGRSAEYPFLDRLAVFGAALQELCDRPAAWYVAELPGRAEAFADLKDELYEPAHAFFTGPQREIYDAAAKTLREDRQNLHHIDEALICPVRDALADPHVLTSGRITRLKAEHEALRAAIRTKVAAERDAATRVIEARRDRLRQAQEYTEATPEARDAAEAAIAKALAAMPTLSDIPVLQNRVNDFEGRGYPALMNELLASAAPTHPDPEPIPPAPAPETEGEPEPGPAPEPAPRPAPPPRVVSISRLRVSFEKATIGSDEDVEAYLDKMREVLTAALREGKRITV
jgi:energy-coupling factor transporter ATP-binding protein EcfA2